MSFEGKLNFHSASDVGVQREENQDFFGVFEPSETGAGWLFVVADGMGGAAGGATASRMAVNTIQREYRTHVRSTGDVFDSVRHAIEVANEEIYNRSQIDPDVQGMGTTANVVVIQDEVIFTAHVGDSRTYRFRDGRLERLTRDHTQVQELVDQGIITPGKARHHPQGHIISRNLGGRPQVTVDIPPDGPFRVRDGDVFLVCSDGLYGLVDDEAIAEILAAGPPQATVPALIELANRRGGHDNITVIVVCAGTSPMSWAAWTEGRMKALLDGLQSDRPTDTATFNVQYQDALEPSDFETSRLRAVTPNDLARVGAKPLYSRAPETVREMGAAQAELPGGAPPAPAPAAAPRAMGSEATPTAPQPRPARSKTRGLLIAAVVIVLLLGALLLVGLVVGYFVLGKDISKALGQGNGPPPVTQPADVATSAEEPMDEMSEDVATNNGGGDRSRRSNRRRRRARMAEAPPADEAIKDEVLPLCDGMEAIDPDMTAPYVMRLEQQTQETAIVVTYRSPEHRTAQVRCRVEPGERIRLPRSKEMLTFSVLAPVTGELQCSPRYEGTDPIDVHLSCTARSENLRGDLQR